MNNAAAVDRSIEEWTRPVYGYTKAQLVGKIAAACLGWPYVFGARGQECTVSYRRGRSKSVRGKEGEVIAKECQVLNGSRSSCKGCKWYPGDKRVRCFDCRGFTWWVLKKAGISIIGGGATSQWNNNANWEEKGTIDKMPRDKCCVLFWQSKKDKAKMGHTGLYVGGSYQIIHCSGKVKTDTLATEGWTHYAIPYGLYGDVPVPTTKPTIKKGSSGVYVKECQEDLIALGYDLGKCGADSKFGKMTKAAVLAFQKANGLKQDGIVGKRTWAALDKAKEEKHESESAGETQK